MESSIEMTREELREISSTIDTLMDLGREQEAEELLNRALEESRNDPAYYPFFQAEAAAYLHDDHRSRQQLLKKGLKAAPHDAFLLRNMGGGYLLEKRFARARQMFEEALAAEPEDADTLRSLGLLYSMKGKESRGIRLFRKAMEIKSDDYDSMRQIGVSLSKLGRDEEALAWYKQAIACYNEDYDAMRQMGVSYAMLGEYDTAITWLDRALEINPNDWDSKRNKHLVQLKQSGKGRTFLDAIMIRIFRFFTLAWRRFVDRFDQFLHEHTNR